MAAIAGAQLKSALVSVNMVSSFSGARLSTKAASISMAPLKINRLSVSCAAQPETLEAVRDIIAVQLGKPKDHVKPELPFTDLGADSLDTVEIVMAFEEKFGITIDDSMAEKLKTVSDAADLIEELKA